MKVSLSTALISISGFESAPWDGRRSPRLTQLQSTCGRRRAGIVRGERASREAGPGDSSFDAGAS